MGNPDKKSVVARIKENTAYVSAFRSLFGEAVFGDGGRAYAAMTKAIAAFERTAQFSLSNSKYDRSLRGEAKLSEEEALDRDPFLFEFKIQLQWMSSERGRRFGRKRCLLKLPILQHRGSRESHRSCPQWRKA